jgi:hypothetical protein
MVRKRRLTSQWFDGCVTEKELSDREALVLNSQQVLGVLADIVRKELKALDRKYSYDSPAWQYDLAMDNGQKKKLHDLLTLLTPVIGE